MKPINKMKPTLAHTCDRRLTVGVLPVVADDTPLGYEPGDAPHSGIKLVVKHKVACPGPVLGCVGNSLLLVVCQPHARQVESRKPGADAQNPGVGCEVVRPEDISPEG